jgi:benzylsuccinate CoA-transferase BbsF subunit
MEKVFEGIKVAEFAWAVVGPTTSKYLADHGATVIKIESHKRIELLRETSPFANNLPHPDGSAYFGRQNSNKYGVSIDLQHPNGRKLAWKLIEWADIVTESFSPGTMEKWGLGYQAVRKTKPDIIYLSSSMQGRGGPHESYAGYGMNAACLAGFGLVSGWPDRMPSPPYGGYTDYIAPRFNAAALIAALEYRRRTGRGQWLEESQFEASLHFFSPPVMDYQVNGRILNRNGNRLDNAAPHGVYQCQGDDRWIALAVFSEKDWRAFCTALGNPVWTQREDFSSLALRKKNEDELDRLVTEWTLGHTAQQAESILQSAGVPCNMVERSSDVYQDPQLAHRARFTRLDHPVMGSQEFETQTTFLLSETPRELDRPSPCLGQHNEYVFKGLLGIPDEEYAGFIAEGSITTRMTRELKPNM